MVKSPRSRGPPGSPARRSIGFSARAVTPHLDSATENLSVEWFAERLAWKLWSSDESCQLAQGGFVDALPRYRLRTLVIAVAVAALGMGTVVGLAQRRESYLRQAAHHRKLSNNARLYAMSIDRRYLHWGPSEPERAEMAAYERRGDYQAALQAKYEAPPATPGSPSSKTGRSRIDFLRAKAVNHSWRGQAGAGRWTEV